MDSDRWRGETMLITPSVTSYQEIDMPKISIQYVPGCLICLNNRSYMDYGGREAITTLRT